MADNKSKRKTNKTLWVIVLLLSLLLIAMGIGVYAWVYVKETFDFTDYRNEPPVTRPVFSDDTGRPGQNLGDYLSQTPTEEVQGEVLDGQEPTEQELPSNPIDFPGLQEINSDIYAWIFIPNADIDLPIFQASPDKNDDYYIYRNVKGEYEFKGSIYTQRQNKKNFTDPVTVIYGHHMYDHTMFSNLHYFMDKDFFEENEYFYIYTPGHILTYRIVSAHEFDERHILNSFDFSNDRVFRDYLDYIMAPRTMVANVRESEVLTTQDRIVTLSTCTVGGNARYLVQGVLISDEPTAQ